MAIKITSTLVQKLALSISKPTFIYDTAIVGFGLKVTKTKKTFIAEGRVKGCASKTRTTLGTFPSLTVAQARELSKQALGQMAQGINPNASARKLKLESITLQQAFDEYMSIKTLKPRTIRDYQENMQAAFNDWRKKPLTSVNKKAIQSRHGQLGQRSHARADNAMRMLRAIFNFAINQYEDEKGVPFIQVNPVTVLSQMKLWYKVKRRQSVIKQSELNYWFNAVMNLQNNTSSSKAEVARDYFLFLLFTGLRRTEAATMRWEHIDLTGRTFKILDTKNGSDHELPLSDFLHDLLHSRMASANSEYVFPGKSTGGHIVEPKRWVQRVRDESGVNFSLHDLRRTFATIAESQDIPAYALKALLNHSNNTLDVTAGYLVISTERLRGPMQAIADCILEHAHTPDTYKN